MTSFRVTLALVFIIAFTMIACSDGEETPTSPGGSPPPDTNVNNVCTMARCAESDIVRTQCEIFLNQCLLVEDEDDCVGGAWAICNAP